MAESGGSKGSGRGQKGKGSGRGQRGKGSGGGQGKGSRGGGLSAGEAVDEARRQLGALIGRPVESVFGMERDDDDNWRMSIQVVELARIPNSTDVLGSYDVTLDGDGDVVSYRRTRRYARSQADEG
jgi:Gas vesicle synthesis protein GvpO